MIISKKTKAFSLIELVIYVSLSSIIFLAITSFSQSMTKTKTETKVINEVENQGAEIIQIITQAIRNAENINLPSQNSSGSLLSLNFLENNKNPTIFYLLDQGLVMEEGSSGAISLTNNLITISNLEFNNLSLNQTPGIIQIKFTLKYNGPLNAGEYTYEKNFYNSASLR